MNSPDYPRLAVWFWVVSVIRKPFRRYCNRSGPRVILAEAHTMWTQDSENAHICVRKANSCNQKGELWGLVPALTFLLQREELCWRFIPNRNHLNTHSSFPLVLCAPPSHWNHHPPSGSAHLPLSISHSFFTAFGSLSSPLSSNHELSQSWAYFQNLSLSPSFARSFSWEKLHHCLGTQSSHLDSGLLNPAQRTVIRIKVTANIKSLSIVTNT